MRLPLVTRFLLLLGAAAVLASCGHGNSSSSSTTNTPSSITTNPSSFSLNHGDVTQFTNVQVLNSSKTAISPTPTVTYASADPSLVTVTSAGLVCAGVFDANNIVCQTVVNGTPLRDATVNITVTAGGISTTVPVFVHARVDAVKVSGPANPPVCISQNQTEQFTAQALSNGNDVTSRVGPFTWATGNSVVATVDSNGVVTSRQPGATTVVASVASTTGTPALIVACPPKSISLHVTGVADTAFTVASGTSQTLVADVTDILGQPIAGAALKFFSFVPTVASITSAGAVTTPGAGVTALGAACVPPSCNPGNSQNVNGAGAGLAVYSNTVVATVTGTTATTVYVTGKDNPDGSANTSLIPIDITANTAGTAIALPGSPNSMVFNKAGSTAFLGTSAGMVIFDTGTNTVTGTASSITGTVLAVSNDGSKVVVSDTTQGKVFVFDTAANASQVFDLPGVTAADFDGGTSKGYFTAGSAVFEYSPAAGEKQISFAANGLSGLPTPVAFTPQGAIAYFGGNPILGLAVCNDTQVDSVAAAANILVPAPDGTHMIGASASGWIDLRYTIASNNGCPSTVSKSLRTAGFPAFVGTPAQIAVASDDSNAFLTGYTGGGNATAIPFYHLADGTTGSVALTGSGGALFSGRLTQDAHSLYVGVGSAPPQVHRIDLTASGGPADATQINVTFNPRIVVVRPK